MGGSIIGEGYDVLCKPCDSKFKFPMGQAREDKVRRESEQNWGLHKLGRKKVDEVKCKITCDRERNGPPFSKHSNAKPNTKNKSNRRNPNTS